MRGLTAPEPGRRVHNPSDAHETRDDLHNWWQ